MALSRRLGVIGILGVSWLLAIGCGSDDDKKVSSGDAGEAGESTGGTPSSGGSANNAGKGGTSTAGKGGTANAGSAGKGGTAGSGGTNLVGEAGEGGDGTSLGGAGGAAESGAGGGAEAGAAGAGGDGSGPTAQAQECAYQCEQDDDCAIDGVEFQKICDPTSKLCVDAGVIACTNVDDCAPSSSFWSPCQTNDDCDDGFACVNWHGSGYCAYTPDCLEGDVQITLGEFGKPDSPIDVCYTPGACVAGACQFGCELIGCDGGGSGDTCSPTTHECECTTGGDECATTGVCGADHHCTECAVDEDCAGGLTGQDKCVNGKCGCSGAAACPNPTANATALCQ